MYGNSQNFRLPAGYKVIWNNRSSRAESTTVTSSVNGDHQHEIGVPHRRGHDFSGKQEAILRKMTAQHVPEGGNTSHDSIDLGVINVEEMIMYVLLVFLLIYVFTHIVKCVRITLDPYNTAARGAWMETLEKRDSKIFSNFGLRNSASST